VPERPPPAASTEQACYYGGSAYSPGALAIMGRIEKACELVDGRAVWVRE